MLEEEQLRMAIDASLLTVQTESELQRGSAPVVAAPHAPVQPPSEADGRGAGRGHGRGVARSAMQQRLAAEEPRAPDPPPPTTVTLGSIE